ncbi:MAG TPA: HD domain-containing protein [Flavobacteriia bacterium]|nr:HD domain-containing protein [Flavobacteriia bacterium]
MVIEKNKTIDKILDNFKNVLKADFEVYKNHVYRIYNYAVLFDANSKNDEKYAIAAAFHDMGIWTHSFDYLEPSIQLATTYLKETEREEWIEEVSLLIDNHHKMSVYKGKFKKTVEAFRKADWIDVTRGMKSFGLEKSEYKAVQALFSNKGFHWFLLKQSVKYFVKHPLHPLPMFKK